MAEECSAAGDHKGAGMKYLACAHAARSALHMCDPASEQAIDTVNIMEDAFQKAMDLLKTGLKPYDFNFKGKTLPGYMTAPLSDDKALYIVIGGGDTYREDLYFFGGSEAVKHGYHVLLVDLPGQGKTPYAGMHFGEDTINALSAVLDQIETLGFKGKKILSGYSGGGYFTTMLLSREKRIDAWIASTPLFDMRITVERAMPALLTGNPSGGLQRTLLGIAGSLNPTLEGALKKYDWQFGPGGLASVLDIFKATGTADYERIDVPSLFLVGMSEDGEAKRQAGIVYESVKQRQPASNILEFAAATGADAHCQVNNLLWAQHHIFHWLDSIELG
ncbi:Alpha/beta hydrolase family protein [compost metagenome]